MKNKKTIISLVIAGVILLLLIAGAAYAYLTATFSASGTTTITTETHNVGSVIVTNPTESLYLRLTAKEMQEANKGFSYYATSTTGTDVVYASEAEYNSIANMKVVGGSDAITYKCTFNINITKPSEILAGDMSLIFKSDGVVKTTIADVTMDSELDLYGANTQYKATFITDGSVRDETEILSAAIKLNNTDSDQSHIEGKNLGVSISLSDMDCTTGTNTMELAESGLYDDEGTMLYSWNELIDNGYITVTDGELMGVLDETENFLIPKGILVIDNTVTSIGNNAFGVYSPGYWSNLTGVIIPDSVESIGYGAFVYNSLQYVTIGSGVVDIGMHAFEATLSNFDLIIPGNVKNIGDCAFCDNNIDSLIIEEGVETIGDYAFYGNKITNISIPSSVTSIGEYVLSSSYLESIIVDQSNSYYDSRDNSNAIIETSTNKLILGTINTIIPYNVTSIGDGAFSGSYLTSIEIPDGVTSIGNSAFSGTKITSIEIPDGVTSIGDYAFSGTKLIDIEIPSSVTSIGSDAFFNCNDLVNVTINNGVKSIGSNAFAWNEKLTTIYIPSSVTTITASSSYLSSPFWGSSSSTKIYTDATSAQSGWETYWNYHSENKVLSTTYGVTIEEYKSTYKQ